MIFIGIGGNLPSEKFGSTMRTLKQTLQFIDSNLCRVLRCSPWYRSAPMPITDEPDYLNAVAEIETLLPATELLSKLHDVEKQFGRVRSVKNASRTVDLDLLIYHNQVIEIEGEGGLRVPHPRMAERAFVLLPFYDLASNWVHPISKQPISNLIRNLSAEQRCERVICDKRQ
ncbi:MAG: 2-amino-4-hydroxy-6-hydroxymethyldihydropteridine diphosphokinase [Rhodospirillaceae bacterium]|nr:2-amino-4-hydroxy-6-hydroxymethyldihydropteridine diphosphokinase [Rhodospirillaceae bacterium]